jgi:hypothetical protein
MIGEIIQKVIINVRSEISDDAQRTIDTMCLADWRWAASKGYWDCARQCWNEDLGGMQAYLVQRNLRRAENFDRKSRRLERTRNKNLNPRWRLAPQKRRGAPDHFYQAPSSGHAAYLHGSAGVDWFPPLTPDSCVGSGSLLDFMFKNGWGHLAVRSLWSAGFQAETVVRIFKELPPSLLTAITEAIDSAQISAACAAKHVDPDIAFAEITTKSPQEQVDCSVGGWEGDSAPAFVELYFDPETQVRIGAAANTRAAALLGIDRTELLARLEKQDVPLPLGPLDAVAMFLHNLSASRDSIDTCYYRLTPSASHRLHNHGEPLPPAVLVCRTTVRAFDAFGRLHKVPPPTSPPSSVHGPHSSPVTQQYLDHFRQSRSICCLLNQSACTDVTVYSSVCSEHLMQRLAPAART